MTDTKIEIQTSKHVENNVSTGILDKLYSYFTHIFYGNSWDIARNRGRDISNGYKKTNGNANCGGSNYELWDWMQDNQVSGGVDLLVIDGDRWSNDSPGCGGGSSAYVSVNDGSIANVADPSTGNSYLIGDGTEGKGEREISTALMEVGHCWNVAHDDGISILDLDSPARDCVSPMIGNYASRKDGSLNNCDYEIKYNDYSIERRFCAYTDCAAQNIPNSDGIKHYSHSELAGGV